jgi:NAD(P)H dehydrogenase (quinone)
MRILVILGHPDPASFNRALAGTACRALRENGHEVVFHDLCAERFDPCLPRQETPEEGAVPDDVRAYTEDLRAADGIVVAHPNWWGQPPALRCPAF